MCDPVATAPRDHMYLAWYHVSTYLPKHTFVSYGSCCMHLHSYIYFHFHCCTYIV